MAYNTANAFSHWTWKYSNRTVMATDLQGVGATFTDCVITSLKQKFGFDDLGKDAIDAFFDSHECNDVCRIVGVADYTQYPPAPSKSISRRGNSLQYTITY